MKEGKKEDGKKPRKVRLHACLALSLSRSMLIPSEIKRFDDPLLKIIEFRIMRDLSEPPTIVRREHRPTDAVLYLTPVPEVLHDDTKREEILWNFIRLDDEKKRLTLSQNPHFYGDLPTSPIGSAGKFRTTAILENWHAHHSESICVLTNTLGRVFLELDRPPRAFDNVLDMNGSFIFKSW